MGAGEDEALVHPETVLIRPRNPFHAAFIDVQLILCP